MNNFADEEDRAGPSSIGEGDGEGEEEMEEEENGSIGLVEQKAVPWKHPPYQPFFKWKCPVKKKKKKRPKIAYHRYCSYCYERTLRSEMLNVPSNQNRVELWIKVLGPQFEYFMRNKQIKVPMICRKHFKPSDLIVDSRQTRIFFTAVPQREEKYEGRAYPESPYYRPKTEKKAKKSKQKSQICCAYCLKNDHGETMKMVPRAEAIREMWCRRLGEGFREAVEKKEKQRICLSHFPDGEATDFTTFVLPRRMNDEVISIHDEDNCISGQYGFKCVYCYQVEFAVNMVSVPDGIHRYRWIDILGVRFGENLKIMPRSFICKTHFASQPLGKAYGIPTPVLDPNIDEGKMKELDAKSLRLREKYPRFKCSYCSESRLEDEMISPEISDSQRDTWSDELGYEFEHNLFMINEIWLCVWHFYPRDFLHNRLRSSAIPRQYVSFYLLSQVSKRALLQFAKIVWLELEGRWETLQQSRSEVWRTNNFLQQNRHASTTVGMWNNFQDPKDLQRMNGKNSQFRECCYCNWTGKLRFMRRVVECPNKFRKWVEILGEEFELNCWKYEEPAICRSHFSTTDNDADLPLQFPPKPESEILEFADAVKKEPESEGEAEGETETKSGQSDQVENEENPFRKYVRYIPMNKLPRTRKDAYYYRFTKEGYAGEWRELKKDILANGPAENEEKPAPEVAFHKLPKWNRQPLQRKDVLLVDLNYALLDHTYASYRVFRDMPPTRVHYIMPTCRTKYPLRADKL